MVRVCPTCKRPLPVDAEKAPHRPFCSPRCKMADMGGWLTGAYRISRPLGEEDLDGGIPHGAMGDPEADSGRLDGQRRDDDGGTPPPRQTSPSKPAKRGSSGTRRTPKVH
jgi:endogenous inhibitor of DNA gyrase (YacG/DUF329 family)